MEPPNRATIFTLKRRVEIIKKPPVIKKYVPPAQKKAVTRGIYTGSHLLTKTKTKRQFKWGGPGRKMGLEIEAKVVEDEFDFASLKFEETIKKSALGLLSAGSTKVPMVLKNIPDHHYIASNKLLERIARLMAPAAIPEIPLSQRSAMIRQINAKPEVVLLALAMPAKNLHPKEKAVIFKSRAQEFKDCLHTGQLFMMMADANDNHAQTFKDQEL